jgi:L-aspartate oxidase
MWAQVGLVRDAAGLSAAQNKLAVWQHALPEPVTPAEYELRNMVLIGRLMATAARERRESRGSQCRRDFPDTDTRWQRHIVLSKAADARSAKEAR